MPATPAPQRHQRHQAPPKTMTAVVWNRYGAPEKVLSLTDVPVPIVAANEVLVRVHAAGLNPYDWRHYRGDPMLVRLGRGLRRPKFRSQLGSDLAGEVVRVGANVVDFAPGDLVHGGVALGSLAQYVAVDVDRLALIPRGTTFEQAAALPMCLQTAMASLKLAEGPLEGKSVLVNGASGGIGHLAVQLAKSLGASRVVGVCSQRNADWVQSIGADRVVDYTAEDYTEIDEKFDLFIETQYSQPWHRSLRVLRPGGVFAFAGGGGGKMLGPAGPMLRAIVGAKVTRRKVRVARAGTSGDDLARVDAHVAAGAIRAVIDKSYPIARIVEAAQHLESGHVAGKVVVTVP